MYLAEIISAIVAFVAALIAFSGSKLFRVIFWESVKHPNRKVEIEVQGSEIKIKAVG